MVSLVEIRIIARKEALAPEAPSHLEPGLADDKTWFQVKAQPYPSKPLINHLLSLHCSDWILNNYNQEIGCGDFTSIDLEGPEVDSILDISSSIPLPESRVVILLREPNPR